MKLRRKAGDLHIELLIVLLVTKILIDQIWLELRGLVPDLYEIGIIASLRLNLLKLLHHILHMTLYHLGILRCNHIELFHLH